MSRCATCTNKSTDLCLECCHNVQMDHYNSVMYCPTKCTQLLSTNVSNPCLLDLAAVCVTRTEFSNKACIFLKYDHMAKSYIRKSNCPYK